MTTPKKPVLTVVDETLPPDHVKIIITKLGGGKVQKGTQSNGRPDFFKWRDEVILPRRVADALEARYFGEIDE